MNTAERILPTANPNIGVEDVTAVIRSLGWTKTNHPNPNFLVYENGVDDNGDPIKLVLPNGNDFADAPDKIASAINLIAWKRGSTVEEIMQLIRNRGTDIFRQRLIGNTKITGLPLELAATVIGHLRELVYYSACAEEDPQPFFEKGRKIGRDYTTLCRFGHTFAGSFGLSIEMPIPPNPRSNLIQAEPSAPLERRIMYRIMRGLITASKGVREGEVAILTDNYATGFNANLCETMAGLTEVLAGLKSEYSMLWSPEFQVADDLRDAQPVMIDPGEFRRFFESAAKSLRKVKESQETAITGSIIQLRADLEDDGGENLFHGRKITIKWDIGTGRSINIRAALNADDYKLACDAHKDNRMVQITGIPEKLGKSWDLTSPKHFRVLSTNG
ncbi:MAG: hypothetical protein ACP5QA_13035 [Phycisphaerae bacterium]